MTVRPAPTPPAHTPYDGSATPFTIGLKPLDLDSWLEMDGERPRYLAEKERLWRAGPDAVFAATTASRAAQTETLALVLDHVARHLPDLALSEAMERDPHDPPLWQAARLVQEDLVLMERHDDGWRLTAASLSFPSSWSLAEKFDRPMQEIHAGVPEFGPATRNAQLIDRMFDNLKVERPVWRLNWSIYPDAALHHPKTKTRRGDDFLARMTPEGTFIRVERQTLRRLPATGALLFTIRIHVDPVSAIIRHGEGARLAAGLRAQLEGLDAAQLDYKGLRSTRQALCNLLDRVVTDIREM